MQRTLPHAGALSLRELLPEAKFFGDDDVHLHSCCGDAARCQPGDVFVAMDGVDGDQHDRFQEALQRGASAIVTERYLPVSVPLCLVPNTHQAYGHICQSLAGQPGESLQLIGVTGTNGKTTTSMLIAAILQAAGGRCGVLNSIRRSDACDVRTAARTTPTPPEMAKWLTRMTNNGCSRAVLELSSRGLAQHRTAGLRFDAAVLTNIRRDHLDYHGSILNYRRTKQRVFEQLKPAGFAVINADDPGSRMLLPKLSAPTITYGMREPAEVTAEVLERHPSEQTFLLLAGNESVPVCTHMIGDHHVANCLAAAATSLVLGIDLATIARGLETVERLPARLERLECGQPFGVFVDCCGTPDRLALALKALRKVTRGRVLCVFGTDDELPADDRPMLGRVLERAADLSVITGPAVPQAEPLQPIHDVLDGYERAARAHLIPSREQAIAWTLGEAKPGDMVLIANAHRTVTWDRDERPHDDWWVAEQWLRRNQKPKPWLTGVN